MANEVIVALDGSEKGRRALAVALPLAALAESAVHLVRVIEPTSARTRNQAELLGIDPLNAAGRLDVEKQLADIAEGLTATTNRRISWEVLEGEDVAAVLIRVAAGYDARAVVMGTRAPTKAGLAIVGSVADEVMRECSRPVVLVPPGASDLDGKVLEIKRVLVPLDGSALALQSLDFLAALPHVCDLEFVLLDAVQDPQDIPVAEHRLHSAAERLRSCSARVAPRVILDGDPSMVITTAVREFLVDIIAMSTRGESGLRRLMLGSVAQGVIRAAEVPVLLLTPRMLAASFEHARAASLAGHTTE